MELQGLLTRIEDSLVEVTKPTRQCSEVGPFLLLLDPGSDLIFLNYAVPLSQYEDHSASIEELIEAFHLANRRPRLEFTKERWPRLLELLLAADFEVEAEQPTMVLERGELRCPRPVEAEVKLVQAEDDLASFMAAAAKAFGMEESIGPERVMRMRRILEQGHWKCAWAIVDGQVAAVATITPSKGVGELAGVGTVPEFRRRGFASAVSGCLLEDHFRSSDFAWLSAGDDAARLVYEALGFKTVATRLCVSMP